MEYLYSVYMVSPVSFNSVLVYSVHLCYFYVEIDSKVIMSCCKLSLVNVGSE